MNIKIIYHRADFDGICSGKICQTYLAGKNPEMIGWDFGDPIPQVEDSDIVYMVDLSIEELMNHPNLIWIDHHKSAIQKYSPQIQGYRIDGVAACRLCYQWFSFNGRWSSPPVLEDFRDGKVIEPYAVRLLGEYDVFDKRDPNVDYFQLGMRALDDIPWGYILVETGHPSEAAWITRVITNGVQLSNYVDKNNEDFFAPIGFNIILEKYTFKVINSRGNSLMFKAFDKDEYLSGYISWFFDGEMARVSIYGHPTFSNADFSPIAIKFGGGGHAKACGFRMKIEEWIKLLQEGKSIYDGFDYIGLIRKS